MIRSCGTYWETLGMVLVLCYLLLIIVMGIPLAFTAIYDWIWGDDDY